MRWLRIRDSSTDINGSNHGQVMTGDGNTVTFVKNDHIVLEDYDMSKSDIFYQLFAFEYNAPQNQDQ